jgi:hypothetical protein
MQVCALSGAIYRMIPSVISVVPLQIFVTLRTLPVAERSRLAPGVKRRFPPALGFGGRVR